MSKQAATRSEERKLKFAEAGIIFVLVLAVTVFVGVRLASHPGRTAEEMVITQATPAATATFAPDSQSTAVPRPQELVVVMNEPAAQLPVTYAMAEQSFHRGDYRTAAAQFTTYTMEHPANAWGFYMLGLSEWKAGRADHAEEAFLVALELKPDHTKSLINYGRVLLDLERPTEARAQVELALAADPGSLDANRLHARICHAEGQLDDAADSYLKLLQSRPEDVWSLNNLGLIRIEQGRFGDALAPLAKAAGLRDDLAVVQNNLGVALERTGHYAAAAAAYEGALAANADYAKADESLARVSGLIGSGDPADVDLVALAAGFSPHPSVAVNEEGGER